jgi:NADH dehydrogenase FAD-containing subunit
MRLSNILFKKANSNRFVNLSLKSFAHKHSQIIVIGAGTGGLAVSSQLTQQKIVNGKNITIFDPTNIHYYQPGYTKLGGGILDSLKDVEYRVDKLTNEYNFQNVAVKEINPEKNEITTTQDDVWSYDHLVVSPGLEVKLDSIPGKVIFIY